MLFRTGLLLAFVVIGSLAATIHPVAAWDSESANRPTCLLNPEHLALSLTMYLTSHFTASPTEGTAPLEVDFTDQSRGRAETWFWVFGDTQTSHLQNPSHTYRDPGIYSVRMTASNDLGSDAKHKRAYIWAGFPDVSPEHWAFRPVLLCAAGGIVSAYPDDLYHPTWEVSRDQMAVFISRALTGGDDNVPDGPTTATFDDVPTDHWAYKYVEYCAAEGIVQGFDPVTYGPTFTLTRDAMAVFISRALAGGDDNVPDGPAEATFDDVPTDNWAYRYVEYCAADGIVKGYDPLTYRPTLTLSRDQMAVFVSRALALP